MGAPMSAVLSSVRVKNLALKLPRANLAPQAQALIEESLELCAAEWGQQHLVIRRLSLGRLQLATGARRKDIHAAVRHAVQAAARQALPAFAPSAHQADAVVFSSALEARAMLASQLLDDPSAPLSWYWPRAVPEWQPGMGAQPLLVALTRSAEGRVALAKAMSMRAVTPPMHMHGHEVATLTVTEVEALNLLAIWPGFPLFGDRQMVLPGNALPLWLGLQGLLAAAPHLAAEPDAVRRMLADKLASNTQNVDAANAPPTPLKISAPRRLAEAQHLAFAHDLRTTEHFGEPRVAPVRHRPAEQDVLAEAVAYANEAPLKQRSPTSAVPSLQAPQAPMQDEVFSPFAGLFLLIQPLRFLGFEQWLARHPIQAAAGFGWQLLAHVADRQKLPEKDGARACLWSVTDDKADPLLLHTWRAALNGLLRRKTGHTLAAVVKRRGWITRSDAGLSVRFPQNGADIGLRRMRFDLDPQFVSWLGLHVAYRYEDRLGS
jgi:hypothetical protein